MKQAVTRNTPDGSRTESSGPGYFAGAFNGADQAVKDTKRFGDRGWDITTSVITSRTHRARWSNQRRNATACHMATAKKDDVWTPFYPLLDN